MKFFVDTADVAEIRKLNDVGIVDGVTTNPTLKSVSWLMGPFLGRRSQRIQRGWFVRGIGCERLQII